VGYSESWNSIFKGLFTGEILSFGVVELSMPLEDKST